MFSGIALHPSCALFIWLVAVLGIQFSSYPAIATVMVTALVVGSQSVRTWFGYVRRARWLLLSLWLILAYNTAGEAFMDLPWAPTEEGIAVANLQSVRLVAMLAFLACLFSSLGLGGVVSGLWGGLRPLSGLGLDIERLVVRLSLVLENLQTPQPKGAWRQMLHAHSGMIVGPATLRIDVPLWQARDTLIVLIAVLGLIGVIWL